MITGASTGVLALISDGSIEAVLIGVVVLTLIGGIYIFRLIREPFDVNDHWDKMKYK